MVLGVVNLVVTLLALADISPTAFLVDLVITLVAWVGSGGFAFFAADLVVIGGM